MSVSGKADRGRLAVVSMLVLFLQVCLLLLPSPPPPALQTHTQTPRVRIRVRRGCVPELPTCDMEGELSIVLPRGGKRISLQSDRTHRSLVEGPWRGHCDGTERCPEGWKYAHCCHGRCHSTPHPVPGPTAGDCPFLAAPAVDGRGCSHSKERGSQRRRPFMPMLDCCGRWQTLSPPPSVGHNPEQHLRHPPPRLTWPALR